jgi:hypothetical protein
LGAPVTHATTGTLTGSAGSLAGTADRTRAHGSSGALSGPGAQADGSASRLRAFSSSGALNGQAASLAGSAARSTAAVTHDTSGALVGPGAQIDGQAARGVAAAGGYDDEDKPSKPQRRRFIQKRGDKLIVTTDASQALAAVDEGTAEPAADQAPQAVAEPVAQEISLSEIRSVAAQYQQQARVLQMFRQRDWAEMVALYEALKRQQDEDDIEMLLLSL